MRGRSSAIPPREEGAAKEVGAIKGESSEGVEVGVGKGESSEEVKEGGFDGWHPLIEPFLKVGKVFGFEVVEIEGGVDAVEGESEFCGECLKEFEFLFVEFEYKGAIRQIDPSVEVVFEAEHGFFEEAAHTVGVPRWIEHHGVVLLVHGVGHTAKDEVGFVSVECGGFVFDVFVESVVEVGDMDLTAEVLGKDDADQIVIAEQQDLGFGVIEGFAEALCASPRGIEAAIELIEVDDGLGAIREEFGNRGGDIVGGFGVEPIEAQEIARGFAQITGEIALFKDQFVLGFDVVIEGLEVLAQCADQWADDLGGCLGPCVGQFVSDQFEEMMKKVADAKTRMGGREVLRP